jgi:hypothetical protein
MLPNGQRDGLLVLPEAACNVFNIREIWCERSNQLAKENLFLRAIGSPSADQIRRKNFSPPGFGRGQILEPARLPHT